VRLAAELTGASRNALYDKALTLKGKKPRRAPRSRRNGSGQR